MVKNFEKICLSFFLFVFLVPLVSAAPLSEKNGTITINPLTGNVILPGNATYPLGHSCAANSQCNSTFCEGNVCCNQACTGSCGNCGTFDCSTGTCSCSGDKNANGASCTSRTECCSDYCDVKCAPQPTPSGGGSSSGGGYYFTTTTSIITLATETETVSHITNGTSGTFSFTTSNALKITSIDLLVNDTVNDASITITESSLPAGMNAAIGSDGVVYKYLQITTNVPNSKIGKVTIDFKIEKSWITANNIDISTISMKRYVNGNWISLPTVKVSEDSTYVYFEATSPGFSLFAITGIRLIATSTSTVSTTSSSFTSSTSSTSTTTVAPFIIGPSTWLALFLLLIIIGVVIFAWKRESITKAVMPS